MWTMPARLAAFVGALRDIAPRRSRARLPRSLGRRAFRHAGEMSFAGHCGVTVNLDVLAIDPVAADWGDFKIRPEQVTVRRHELTLKALFTEELGAVLQIRAGDKTVVMDTLRAVGLGAFSQIIGKPNAKDVVEFWCDAKVGVLASARCIAEGLERNVLAHRAAA